MNQKCHFGKEISISDSYAQFRVNLLLAARDSAELRNGGKHTVGALVAASRADRAGGHCARTGALLFPALHRWVTPTEAHVYETAVRLLTERLLDR